MRPRVVTVLPRKPLVTISDIHIKYRTDQVPAVSSSALYNPVEAQTLTNSCLTCLNRKYAYVPPSTPQVHAPQMSHAQAAPRMVQRTRQHPESQAQISQGRLQESMPPPRFKPAGPPPNIHKTNTRTGQYEQQAVHQNARTDNRPRKAVMGPPPTPQHIQHLQPGSLEQPQMQSNAALSSRRSTNSVPATNRFLPPEERFAPQALKHTQRFVPPTPTSAPQRFTGGAGQGLSSGSTPNSRAPSRAQPPNMAGGGQRMPFVPGGHRGFAS